VLQTDRPSGGCHSECGARSMTVPQLAIVVDTEEEFDWTKPVSRASRATASIPAQVRAHEIYDRFGVVPTYVIDHPVATDPVSIDVLGGLRRAGRAEIGAHLHPWVSPPDIEAVTPYNSFHCNLPPAVERAKIVTLTETIEQNFAQRPCIFKAGRYGFGPNTQAVLIELGYTIDTSFVPHVSFAGEDGPNFYNTPDQPFWLDAAHQLFEVPLTSGFFGALAPLGHRLAPLFDSRTAHRLKLPGVLGRSGLIARSRLTPEGVSATEQCRLLRAMVARGREVFVLTYHSPSLGIGHTPYVRTQADLDVFLARITTVLAYFRNVLGGEFTTLTALRERHRPNPASFSRSADAEILLCRSQVQ